MKPIDGAALRKESWILGQCADTYNSQQMASFKQPRVNSEDARISKVNARALKQKVAGTSIRNVSPSASTDPALAF